MSKISYALTMDFASLYPSTISIDENLLRKMQKERLNKTRKEKLKKINNIT